jgi:hypothetical protein
MKKLSLFSLLLLFYTATRAQTDIAKLSTQIKKLSGEWLTTFNNIKGAIKSDSENEAIFYSRLKLEGSVDSTNLIHHMKDRQVWTFTADFDKEKIGAATLDSVIKAIAFSFGKIKSIATSTIWETGYVPANKKGASLKLRSFFILVFDRGKEPGDLTNGKISLTIGEEEYFWNK